MPENMFDLIPVRFGDKDTYARPYSFTQDSEENFLTPIKGITTCPYCGHGQEINFKDNTILNIKCANCGAGNEEPDNINKNTNITNDINVDDIETEILAAFENNGITPNVKASITIDDDNDIQTLKSSCPFIDPVELGLFQIDEL